MERARFTEAWSEDETQSYVSYLQGREALMASKIKNTFGEDKEEGRRRRGKNPNFIWVFFIVSKSSCHIKIKENKNKWQHVTSFLHSFDALLQYLLVTWDIYAIECPC